MQNLNRRDFLKGGVASLACTPVIDTWKPGSLVIDPNDPVAMSAPVQWAANVLAGTMAAKRYESIRATPAHTACIVVAGRPADQAESMALSTSEVSGRRILTASGADARGLVYALLELADQV